MVNSAMELGPDWLTAVDWLIDLYHGAAILFFFHSKQCNQTEARRANSLVPFYVMRISTIIVNGYTGKMTKDGSSVTQTKYASHG